MYEIIYEYEYIYIYIQSAKNLFVHLIIVQ